MPERGAIAEVYTALEGLHAWRGWHWWPDADPFEVCVGAILVQNTMWANVERALDRLRAAHALSPSVMDALSDSELEDLIRPSGQYRQKTKKLRAFLGLVRAHGSLTELLRIPQNELRTRLLATWGIGKETADCILNYAAHYPALAVDAYTIRIFGRLDIGPVASTSYDEWQRFLEAQIAEDRDLRARYHALIVMHCKHLCLKRAPKCGQCSLRERCAFAARGGAV